MFTPDEVDMQIEKYAPAMAAVVIAAVAGITIEDSVRAWADRPANSELATRDMFEELMEDWFGDKEVPPANDAPSNTTVNINATPAPLKQDVLTSDR
jgi:hypothetical protein